MTSVAKEEMCIHRVSLKSLGNNLARGNGKHSNTIFIDFLRLDHYKPIRAIKTHRIGAHCVYNTEL